MSKNKKVSIQSHLKELGKCPGHKQRFGIFTPLLGYPLILSFSLFLLPIYLFMITFSRLYFWMRNQKQIDSKKFYDYDRHKIEHITFFDKIWCTYCEWANGTLQWTIAFTNEIERRYCPIQNYEHPHCPKAKAWRENFLKYGHTPEDLADYYKNQYSKE